MRALANPTGRPLRETSLQIWRAVAAAGPRGAGSTQLYDRFRGAIDEAVVCATLQSLLRGKYIEHTGVNRYGTWLVTAACRTPADEVRPVWLEEPPDADDASTDDASPRRNRTEVAMPAAPASVFNLAKAPFALARLQEQPSGASLERSAQVRRDDREFQRATADHVVLDWKAPTKPDADGGHNDEPVDADRFVCYIDNDGELYLNSSGQELALPLAHTRKLLHYLDHLHAFDLVEAVSGAAS